MEYQNKIFLKDKRLCLLRNPGSDDAEEILHHLILTSGETDYMARYPDEFRLNVEEEAAHLNAIQKSKNELMIAAVLDGKIVANCGFSPVGPQERCRHRAEYGISIQKAYWGLGIGTALLTAALQEAKRAGYEQVELDVVTDNERALALYKKLGFRCYGTREKSFRYRDGRYAALHLMLHPL